MNDVPESARRSAGSWYAIRHGFLWPVLFSLLLAATPWDLVILVRIGLGVGCVVALARAAVSRRRRLRWNLAGLVLTVVLLQVWTALPLKWLDREVGPFAYEEMTLAQLCERMSIDHGMPLSLDDDGPGRMLTFSVPQRMSRRQVLHKLAAETNRRWWMGCCGTGRTLLWGMHPIFICLEQR